MPIGYKFVIMMITHFSSGALKQALSGWPTTSRFSKPAISTMPRRWSPRNGDLTRPARPVDPAPADCQPLRCAASIQPADGGFRRKTIRSPSGGRSSWRLRLCSKSASIQEIRGAVKGAAGGIASPGNVELGVERDPRCRSHAPSKLTRNRRGCSACSPRVSQQIAYELGVSEATIQAHVSAILQKLG